jgi:hypothetical protein
MWVPGGMVFTLHALAVLGLFLNRLDQQAVSN